MEGQEHDAEAIEVRLLLEAIYLKYGYDFRDYAKASIKRRIMHRLKSSGLSDICEMTRLVLTDTLFFESLLADFSIHVTSMFRDPTFYRALREKVVPQLREQPVLKVWHAGCATGEEVYSTAIVLLEEGLYDRTQVYATDFNEIVVEKARHGVFPIDRVREYTGNYQKAGGAESFGEYYTSNSQFVIMSNALKKNIVFADHNLVTDQVFGEMDLIMCRNVLIYFNKELQNRVLRLIRDSLRDGGFLCLGLKESIRFSTCSDSFEDVAPREKIYRKVERAPHGAACLKTGGSA